MQDNTNAPTGWISILQYLATAHVSVVDKISSIPAFTDCIPTLIIYKSKLRQATKRPKPEASCQS